MPIGLDGRGDGPAESEVWGGLGGALVELRNDGRVDGCVLGWLDGVL